ncbi:polyprenyl synthetase family protein [Xylanibacillus composti]|uniref:Farnesyl diphosphate synthase n=1 Tax=Xylanibacillus composti TaxID=1572762 RepID=A0A8J4H6F6_9BACL|nr:farnesyl diphosphate synthase [Xylanibacillus composti]MDT9726295.1 polyprenyl synthetase family protein [Xylanibacillus composti]GIQ70676.1 farnesyl-diphosphate synthase [Xylanibacillus composti]
MANHAISACAPDASIESYIRHYAQCIDISLKQALASSNAHPKLLEAMEYSLMAGGKRLRPILMIAAAESLGAELERIMPVACAVEMIHSYSLVHDDLPAMDDDDYRRGKLTNHKVYGEAMAILAGDGLLTHAFYMATLAAGSDAVSLQRLMLVIREMAALAGIAGMVAGQAADMEGEQGITSLEQLESIHLRKTGDLIVFALRAGGRLSGASEAQLKALESYGYGIGLAFQIQDDILDITGDPAKTGKAANSDERAGKVTYPYFLGMDESRRKMHELTESAKQAVQQAGLPDPQRLLQLADYLMQRDR